MKTTFLLLALIVSGFVCSAQVFVGEVDINQAEDVEVIEVLVDNRSLIKSVDVMVDYGQMQNELNVLGKRLESRIFDPETRSRITFSSTASVVNYLERRGWKNYSVVTREGGFYFYFRRSRE